MDSDLAWVNGRVVDKADAMLIADAFKCSIKSGAIYHFIECNVSASAQ